jgi:CheY-like chemotaxis protein
LLRVLLVDDEELVLESVTATLKALGYDVTGASSGEEAVSLFQQAQLRGEPYQLALLDLSIQGSMDGLETARQIRLLDEKVRLVLLSGYDTDFVLQSHPNHRFDAAIKKPFRIMALARLLEDVLAR